MTDGIIESTNKERTWHEGRERDQQREALEGGEILIKGWGDRKFGIRHPGKTLGNLKMEEKGNNTWQ